MTRRSRHRLRLPLLAFAVSTMASAADGGFKTVDHKATVEYDDVIQQLRFSGQRNNSTHITVGAVNVAVGGEAVSDHWRLGLPLSLGAEDRRTRGTEHVLDIDASIGALVRTEAENTTDTRVRNVIAELRPWVERKLGESASAGLAGDFYYLAPFREAAKGASSAAATAFIGRKEAGRIFLGELSYIDILGPGHAPLSAISRLDLTARDELTGWLALTFLARRDHYVYPNPRLDGPQSLTAARLTLEIALPLGLALQGQEVAGVKTGYICHGLKGLGDVRGDGVGTLDRAVLIFSPVSWVSLQVAAQRVDIAWRTGDPRTQPAFRSAVPGVDRQRWGQVVLTRTF